MSPSLLQRYEELAALRISDQERIKERLQKQEHVILALDGLQPDVGHEVLWVIRDCLSQEILLARPLLSQTQGDITGLLQEVQHLLKELAVPVKGIISDGEETIRSAVSFVFPEVPHQLCQFHYLKDALDPLYEADRHAKTILTWRQLILTEGVTPPVLMRSHLLLAGGRGCCRRWLWLFRHASQLVKGRG